MRTSRLVRTFRTSLAETRRTLVICFTMAHISEMFCRQVHAQQLAERWRSSPALSYAVFWCLSKGKRVAVTSVSLESWCRHRMPGKPLRPAEYRLLCIMLVPGGGSKYFTCSHPVPTVVSQTRLGMWYSDSTPFLAQISHSKKYHSIHKNNRSGCHWKAVQSAEILSF